MNENHQRVFDFSNDLEHKRNKHKYSSETRMLVNNKAKFMDLLNSPERSTKRELSKTKMKEDKGKIFKNNLNKQHPEKKMLKKSKLLKSSKKKLRKENFYKPNSGLDDSLNTELQRNYPILSGQYSAMVPKRGIDLKVPLNSNHKAKNYLINKNERIAERTEYLETKSSRRNMRKEMRVKSKQSSTKSLPGSRIQK